jgi:hypothetical protein
MWLDWMPTTLHLHLIAPSVLCRWMQQGTSQPATETLELADSNVAS